MEVEKVYGIQDLNAETPGWDALAKKIRDAYIANRGVRHVDAEAMKLIEKRRITAITNDLLYGDPKDLYCIKHPNQDLRVDNSKPYPQYECSECRVDCFTGALRGEIQAPEGEFLIPIEGFGAYQCNSCEGAVRGSPIETHFLRADLPGYDNIMLTCGICETALAMGSIKKEILDDSLEEQGDGK